MTHKSLELDSKVKKMIQKYMNEPVAYGTEARCLSDFRNWCVEAYEMPSLVCLRNDYRYTSQDRETAIQRMKDYFANEPRFYSNEFTPFSHICTKGRLDTPTIKFKTKCENYMHDHIGSLAEKACINRYGSVKKAILGTSTWIELWNEFEEWFEERRKMFMEKQKTEIAKINKIPKSHGGVANLLKVLTKTMEQQGADIRTIAKTQFLVCQQAGIYLPDEFITDVAVALDAEGEL